MKTTKITLAMIIATAAIFTSATVIMSAAPTPQAYAQQKCTSAHFTGPIGGGSLSCSTDQTGQEHSQSIQDCRSAIGGGGKCSGSQTSFGNVHP